MTENVHKLFAEAMQILAVKCPSIFLMLKAIDVYYVDEETHVRYATTDGKQIILYKDWTKRDKLGRVKTLMHETLHIVLKHALRAEKIIEVYGKEIGSANAMKIYNMACDTVVDFWIANIKKEFAKYCNILRFIDNIERKSAEDIFLELLKKYKSNEKFAEYIDGIKLPIFEFNCTITTGKDMEQLNKGTLGLSKELDIEKIEQKINKAFMNAIMFAKFAGTEQGGLEILLENLLKPKINWRQIARRQVINWRRKSVIGTWSRPSRKGTEFKGYRDVGEGDLWVFVDVSGSVVYSVNDELRKFMSEVVGIVRQGSGKIRLVFWDTGVTEAVVRGVSDIKRLRKIKGGGGTIFSQAIERYKDEIKPEDCMIVLTDCVWSDVDKSIKILKSLRAYKILVKTEGNERIERTFDKVIRYEV